MVAFSKQVTMLMLNHTFKLSDERSALIVTNVAQPLVSVCVDCKRLTRGLVGLQLIVYF